MRLSTTAIYILVSACAGCASTPDTPQELATQRFQKCMDATLPSFGPVQIATADQRLKAAEVCKSVMTAAEPDRVTQSTDP